MNRVANIFAWFLSAAFHPLLIIMYMLFLYLLINPYLFPYRTGREFGTILIIVFFTSVAIPLVAILLMYSTGLVKSLEMKERTDRIGPLMCTSIAYLWLFLNIRTHNAIPPVFSAFVLGSIIALFISFFVNNFAKISLHAVAMGGLLFAFLHLVYSYGRPYTTIFDNGEKVFSIHNVLLLIVMTVIIGAVLSARLYLKAHKPEDVFGGFIVGLVSQLVAFMVFLD